MESCLNFDQLHNLFTKERELKQSIDPDLAEKCEIDSSLDGCEEIEKVEENIHKIEDEIASLSELEFCDDV